MDFRGGLLEFNPIRMQDNFSQLFLRVSSLYRVPPRDYSTQNFSSSHEGGAVSMYLFMFVLVFMLGVHLYGTPWLSGVDASAAICYSNVALYICLGVGGWSPKCETRCNAGSSWNSIFPWGSPTWPWALCLLKRFPSIRWYLSALSAFRSFLLFLSFLIKRRIYHCSYDFFEFYDLFSQSKIFRWKMFRDDGCPRIYNKFYLICFPLLLSPFTRTTLTF